MGLRRKTGPSRPKVFMARTLCNADGVCEVAGAI